MKRDAGLNKGDQLKITIDTFHDHRNAFYFSTNPLGAYKDANTVENGRTINYDWNAVWDNKTSIDDKGWYIEIAIPLSQLRFRTTIGESTWGINLCRILFRKNEESYWVPFPREWGASGFARVSNAGVLTGLKDLKSRRRIEFVPYLLPTAARDYVTQGDADVDAKYGGDFKFGLTNDLIADLTYHTDFAQVEADQEVVNLTRFSLFFPEKRQFFTESAGIFDFGKAVAGLGGEAAANDPGLLALFYSRRIGLVDGQQVPIIGGGRVTGRIGDYALGVLNISTEEETLATRQVDNANFTAIRVKRNVLAQVERRHAAAEQRQRHFRVQSLAWVRRRPGAWPVCHLHQPVREDLLSSTRSTSDQVQGQLAQDKPWLYQRRCRRLPVEERQVQLRRAVPGHRRALQRRDGLHPAHRHSRRQDQGRLDAAAQVAGRAPAGVQRLRRLLREPRRPRRIAHARTLSVNLQMQNTSGASAAVIARVRQPEPAVHHGRDDPAGGRVLVDHGDRRATRSIAPSGSTPPSAATPAATTAAIARRCAPA